MKRLLYILICLFLFVPQAYAKNWTFSAHDGTTGGTTGKLDNIDQCNANGAGYNLQDKDGAIVWDQANLKYLFYIYNSASEAAESGDSGAEAVVAPDYCDEPGAAGAGRWILAKTSSINWDDIDYLGDEGLPNAFSLTVNSDAGDNNITSMGIVYGFDNNIYADFSVDATLGFGADTSIFNYTPLYKIGYDSAAYLSFTNSDAGGVIAGITSDGSDTWQIGDNSDDIITVASTNWEVDASGNATFASIDVDSSATPGFTGLDSDQSDAEAISIYGDMADANDSRVYMQASIGGSLTTMIEYDGVDEEIQPQYPINSTKVISGGVKSVVDANPADGEIDAYCYGGVFFASGTGTAVLPPVAVNMQVTVENHTADDVYIDPDASGTEDTIRLNGVALTQGFRIIGTDLGDGCVCTYYAADTWSCFCSGYEDAGS